MGRMTKIHKIELPYIYPFSPAACRAIVRPELEGVSNWAKVTCKNCLRAGKKCPTQSTPGD